MKSRLRLTGAAVGLAVLLSLTLVEGQSYQRGGVAPPTPQTAPEDQDVVLPSGKSQRDEILKQEREDNIRDASQLAQLAQQLKEDLEKNDRYVFSLSALKKTDDIEKLAKKIRGRMRHN
jgi:GTPase Era involved in 16S rRNA processing